MLFQSMKTPTLTSSLEWPIPLRFRLARLCRSFLAYNDRGLPSRSPRRSRGQVGCESDHYVSAYSRGLRGPLAASDVPSAYALFRRAPFFRVQTTGAVR